MDKLKIVLSQRVINITEDYVKYYGLAVVKKSTKFNFKELKGKDSCHTGVDKTVGWVIPVGYLLNNKTMKFTKDQYKSAADFFGKSCAPGEDFFINIKDNSVFRTVVLRHITTKLKNVNKKLTMQAN